MTRQRSFTFGGRTISLNGKMGELVQINGEWPGMLLMCYLGDMPKGDTRRVRKILHGLGWRQLAASPRLPKGTYRLHEWSTTVPLKV